VRIVTLGGFFSVFLFCMIFKCGAVDQVQLVAMEFAGSMQTDKQGAFNYMLQDIAEQLAMPLEYEVFVPARGLQIFLNKQADCIVPSANYDPYFTDTPVLHSISFAQSNYIAFTLAEPVINNSADLQDKAVGMIRDNKHWNYESRMAKANITFVGVSDLAALVNMLYLGRIDVAVHDHDDFLFQVSKMNLVRPKYAKNNPLWSENIVITCHDNAENQMFLNQLNPAIQAILHNKKIPEYYKRVAQNTKP
jgi:ABC-type amino acid transport substrate-binding protein